MYETVQAISPMAQVGITIGGVTILVLLLAFWMARQVGKSQM